MRRLLFVSTVVGVGLMAAGCHSGSKDHQPGQSGQDQSGPAWTLTLKSTCLNAATDQCVAKYGFSVSADGKYQMGPGPKGQVRNGSLSESEFADLKTKLDTVSGSIPASRTEGHEQGVENEGDDSLSLKRLGGQEQLVAHNTGSDFYFVTASVNEAKSLHSAIRDLANSYYRMPFGDDCGDAADKVETSYAQFQGCQVDSDCVYVNARAGYEVVPPSSVQWLLTEDCTAVSPLSVANKITILNGARTIADLYTAAQNTCGQEFYRAACAYQQQSTAKAPVCVQNRCQASF
jgi:hypothetical protein